MIGNCSSSLFDRMIHRFGGPTFADHALEPVPFAEAHGSRSGSLFDRMIHRFGGSTFADHALERVLGAGRPDGLDHDR
jgi:hypothetical protein